MSQSPASPGSKTNALQFDKAEPESSSGPPTCLQCGRADSPTHFKINGHVVCPDCRDTVMSALSSGSGGARIGGALLFGGLGAVAGAVVWMTVSRLTGYEIGLIAIAVGYLVGAGVRKGSGGRGGWAYQTMAVVLTYLAIVSTYVPELHAEIAKHNEAEAGAVAFDDTEPDMAADPLDESGEAPLVAGTAAEEDSLELGPVAYWVFLSGIAFALPFLSLPGNIIGLAIIAFAVFQAWKMNARRELEVTGPFVTPPERAVRTAAAPA